VFTLKLQPHACNILTGFTNLPARDLHPLE
jgi:hypothetical protein